MATFGPYFSYAYSSGDDGSCFFPGQVRLQLYDNDIFNQAANDINGSALSDQAKIDANNVLSSIINKSSEAPVPVGYYQFSSGSANGDIQITFEDAAPAGYCGTYQVVINIESTAPEPSVTPSVTLSPSSTPGVSSTPPVTPSSTPSVTPSTTPGATPPVTPTPTRTPALPTISLGNVPSVVNSGSSYTVTATGTSPTSTLNAVVIEVSFNGVDYIEYAADSGTYGPSHTNTGNPYTSISPSPDTITYWRAYSRDTYGQTYSSVQTVYVNSKPTISWVTTPPSTVTQNTSFNPVIVALGADADNDIRGRLIETNIDISVNGGSFIAFAHAGRDVAASFPYSENPYNFPTVGTTIFRAYSVDANGFTSNIITFSVTVNAIPEPSATPSVTPQVTPTVTPSTTGVPGASVTPSVTPTATPPVTPSVTSAPGVSITPTVTPSISISPSAPAPAQLAIYTPWVVALTNSSVWVESIYPISKNVSNYNITWSANGALSATYIGSPLAENYLLYTYLSAAPGETYFTATVSTFGNTAAPSRTLENRFYIKDTLPTYAIENYFDPVTETPTLPYTLSEVLVGSNEWAVSDVINSSFTKLTDNLEYIKNISKVLKLNNELQLIEWCAQLCADSYSTSVINASAFAWKTGIDGLNWENTFGSISAVGVADGIIKDFKSYRFTSNSAPDYYSYIAYSLSGSIPDHIQIRTNDWRNTLVLSATSLGDNILPFTSLSAIEVLNNQLYVLNADTVYRASVSLTDALSGSKLVSLNQVGGVPGNRLSNNGFNNPTEIKAYNDLLYVCDSDNSCVKVYNTALSWVKTLYVDALSAYSTQRLEINRANENVFILGKLLAPIPPVLTNVTSVSSSGGTTLYRISWAHDRQRTNSNAMSAYTVYGLISGGQSYAALPSAVTAAASAIDTGPYTLSYWAASGVVYSEFKVKALGTSLSSEFSNSTPTPSNYSYQTPYKVFEIDQFNNLVSTFIIPNNLDYVNADANITSTTNINKMVIDPSGVFLYFITDEYIYKYLTSGRALNRLTTPSKATLGGIENLKTGFIDDRLNFFVATDKRIFKYVDIPETLDLYTASTTDTLLTPISSIEIKSDEFIQDWVYNKSVLRLLQNHEILYKAIKYKYDINLDGKGNLIVPYESINTGFNVLSLSSIDITKPYTVNQDFFVHSNEFVSSSVINRVLTNIYNLQLDLLQLVSPRITKALPAANQNIL
jgi:hypothetical protein